MAEAVETPPELAGSAYESTVRSKAAELKSELIRQTLEDTESWWEAVQLQYRREHGVPEEVATWLRDAVYKTMTSQEFAAWAKKAERPIVPRDWESATTVMQEQIKAMQVLVPSLSK